MNYRILSVNIFSNMSLIFLNQSPDTDLFFNFYCCSSVIFVRTTVKWELK